MPTFAYTTLSNLKGATAINSNDLSDHGPSGATSVSIGDFVISAIGRDQQGGFGTDLRSRGESSTYPGQIQVGDEFYVIVEVLESSVGGGFWIEQIGFQSGSVSIDATSDIQVLNRQVYTENGQTYLAYYCEVTGTGTGVLKTTMKDGFNTHAQNYNTQLTWDSSVDPNVSIRGGAPEVESVTFTDNPDSTFHAEALFWDPNNQGETGEIYVNLGSRGCERSYFETLALANSNGYRTASTDFPDLGSECAQDYRVNLVDGSGNILDSASGTFTL